MLLHTLVEALADVPDSQDAVPGATVGLNVVTRLLESRIDAARRGSAAQPDAPPRFLLVCEGDVDAPALLAHLPLLAASYNAVCAPAASDTPLLLVPLAAGSELVLSTAFHVRRAAAVLLDARTPGVAALEARARTALGAEHSARGFRVPWLEQCRGQAPWALAAPHLKHVVTSAPVQLNEAKAAKKASRQAHRAARKARAQAGGSADA